MTEWLHFTFQFHALEKEMATHFSVLAGESQGRGSLVVCRLWGRTVGHDWSDLAATAARSEWASLVAQSVKNLPAMQETWIQFLGQEDPLEKEMATHSSILAWRVPWTEEPGRFLVHMVAGIGHNLVTKTQPPPPRSEWKTVLGAEARKKAQGDRNMEWDHGVRRIDLFEEVMQINFSELKKNEKHKGIK